MLKHIKRSLATLVAPRKSRTDILRVRCRLERLEDRAMLSVSYGGMPHSHAGLDLGSYGGGAQHFEQSAAYAYQSYSTTAGQTQAFHDFGDTGGMYRDFDRRPSMQPQFQPRQDMYTHAQRLSSNPAGNQYLAGPPPSMNQMFFVQQPEYILVWWPGPAYPNSVTNSSSSTSNDHTLSLNPGKPNGETPTFGGQPQSDLDQGGVSQLTKHFLQPMRDLSEQFVYGTPNTAGMREVLSSFTDSSAATQTAARETNTVAALSAVAREVAFQEFAPTLFQTNAAISYDRASLGTLGTEATSSDALDGFIRPTDESIAGDTVKSSDVVAREREAVDAVLEELHDIGSLSPVTISDDLNFEIDPQVDTALNELPAGVVDAGMVLLHSTGDANESGFDLAPVYADNPERFEAPAKMETSVGIFQAVDVATDDAPLIETAPPTETTSELKPEIKVDENLPIKREQSSNKAAAVVGATTLTGALVWLSRSGSRTSKPGPTAQKRRASRS